MHEMYNALSTSSEDKRTKMYEKIEQYQTLEDLCLVKDIQVVLINDVICRCFKRLSIKLSIQLRTEYDGTNVKDLTPRKVDASLMIVYTALKLSEQES